MRRKNEAATFTDEEERATRLRVGTTVEIRDKSALVVSLEAD